MKHYEATTFKTIQPDLLGSCWLKKISCGSNAHPGRSQDSQSACSGIRCQWWCHSGDILLSPHYQSLFHLLMVSTPKLKNIRLSNSILLPPIFGEQTVNSSKQVNTFQQTKQTICSTTRDVMIRLKSVTIFSMGLFRFSRAPWLPLSDVGRIINP